MSESLWSIYNRAEEVRIDGLHAFQLRALLKSFLSQNFSNWLVWQEGWIDWQELAAVVDSLFPNVTDSAISHDVQANSFSDKKYPEIPQPPLSLVEAAKLEAVAQPKQERRANARIPVPIKLFLHIDGTVVKNETSDISLGGMKLKNPILKEPKTSFDVTMVHQGTELALRCRLLMSEGETTKTRLLIEKCNRIEILRSWIVEPKKESA